MKDSLEVLESHVPFLELYGYVLHKPPQTEWQRTIARARGNSDLRARRFSDLPLIDRIEMLRDRYKIEMLRDRNNISSDYSRHDDEELDSLYSICNDISQIRHKLLSQQNFVAEVFAALRGGIIERGVYINAPTYRGHVDDISLLPMLETLAAYDDELLREMGIRAS